METEVAATVTTKIAVVYGVVSCILVEIYQYLTLVNLF